MPKKKQKKVRGTNPPPASAGGGLLPAPKSALWLADIIAERRPLLAEQVRRQMESLTAERIANLPDPQGDERLWNIRRRLLEGRSVFITEFERLQYSGDASLYEDIREAQLFDDGTQIRLRRPLYSSRFIELDNGDTRMEVQNLQERVGNAINLTQEYIESSAYSLDRAFCDQVNEIKREIERARRQRMYNNPVDFYRLLAQENLGIDRGSASGDKTVIQKVEKPKPKDPPPSPFSLVELD